MTTAYLADDLKRDEGLRLKAYVDTVGVVTIGYGHAHVAPGTVWTQAQADAALDADIETACGLLDSHLPWWRDLDDVRQDGLANLCFNIGIGSLMGFHNTLQAVREHRWDDAAAGLLASKWASQVGGRSKRLAKQMLTGEHQA